MPTLDVSAILIIMLFTTKLRSSVGWTASWHSPTRSSGFHYNVVCRLNRFHIDPSEVVDIEEKPTITLPKDDYRTIHAAKILNLMVTQFVLVW